MSVQSILRSFGVAIVGIGLAGCANSGLPLAGFDGTNLANLQERPQDEQVELGKGHYARGSYGLAEKSFRLAVEANPGSAEAWLGLAASYDHLRQFNHAERAYNHAMRLQGRTLPILNNLAYHHMLKGNLKKARTLLEEADRASPGHPIVEGNFRLLETWNAGIPG